MGSALRSEAMVALRIAVVALALCFVGGFVFPGLQSAMALILIPTLSVAAWFHRRELRAGGKWTLVAVILGAIGLLAFMISASYLERMLS